MNAIKAFMADQYDEDCEIKFKQVELQNRLFDLFVDLPFSISIKQKQEKATALAAALPFKTRVMSDGSNKSFQIDDVDSDGGTARLLLLDSSATPLSQVVIEGAPGQGKSTLAQYVCQVHRVRWLNRRDELANVAPAHLESPLRLPIKVDLRDLAAWVGGHDPFDPGPGKAVSSEFRSMEAFLARLVTARSGGIRFEVADLAEIVRSVPTILVLDGLDEVADIRARDELITAVTRGFNRMRENSSALRLVITSRPAAFANSPGFDRENFPHIALGSVRRHQIDKYASKWMDARKLKVRERVEFEGILNEKMELPHLRDLARNPMQLTILLSLIHTRGTNLPDKRTSLYDAYVDLFFSREPSKNSVVRRNVDVLKDLHRYVAWTLHSGAETDRRRASGKIKEADLRSLIETYLKKEGHSVDVINDITDALLARVVMIVSRDEGTYEFEVQPLREYFAARFLYDTAPYSPPGRERSGTKPDRFAAMARNFYWLNVTRFFCGCFSKGELLDLSSRVEELCNDPIFGATKYPTSLAALLLSDYVFSQAPKAIDSLVKVLGSQKGMRRLAVSDSFARSGSYVAVPPSMWGMICSKKHLSLWRLLRPGEIGS